MKPLLFKTLQLIGIGILLLGPAHSGLVDHQFTMQVPFDFVAGNQQFAAGDYTIKSDVSTGAVVIRRGDEGPSLVFGTHSAGENKEYARAKLVFNRYGNRCFLTQVWPAGATGRELSKSRQEAETAKAAPQPEVVTLIASASRKASR